MPIGVNNFLTVPYSNESSTAGADGTRGGASKNAIVEEIETGKIGFFRSL